MLKDISFNSFSLKDIITLQSVLVILGYLLIFPWVVGGNLSMYRAESLLLPFVFLLKDVKIQWTISILAILVSIGGVMSYLFFTSVLV